MHEFKRCPLMFFKIIVLFVGCFLSEYINSASKNGHASLHDCYQQCTTRSNTRIFAHRVIITYLVFVVGGGGCLIVFEKHFKGT